MEASIQSGKSTQSGNNMEQCIRDCLACYQECISCIPHCLTQGGKHAETKHITLMMECADMCKMSARFMQLKGQFAYEHCQLCAKVCDECAKSCEAIDPQDSMMQKCADVCRKCAESCRNMGH
ncbi:MAG TPA: four-helix bundle copper-binding protein [Bacteriovoracaceae bacterium]|nr:four-helix bundle copper-binding protein [Bacteriovoracaceae bacterium]